LPGCSLPCLSDPPLSGRVANPSPTASIPPTSEINCDWRVSMSSQGGSEHGGAFGMTLCRQRDAARSARTGYGRCWLAVAAAALATGVYAAQAVVPAAETSPAPIAGIAPSYGPKTVSAVPNATAIVRRIWLPGLAWPPGGDPGREPRGVGSEPSSAKVEEVAASSISYSVARPRPCPAGAADRAVGGAAETGGMRGCCGVAVGKDCGNLGYRRHRASGRSICAREGRLTRVSRDQQSETPAWLTRGSLTHPFRDNRHLRSKRERLNRAGAYRDNNLPLVNAHLRPNFIRRTSVSSLQRHRL
jgi:hypothetical protein